MADQDRLQTLRTEMRKAYLADETQIVQTLLPRASFTRDEEARIGARAVDLVQTVRRKSLGKGGLNAFLHEYDLGTEEGVVLMCLAEALLRIPDEHTADRIIREKLQGAHWDRHLGHSDSWLVNAGTWGLMLSGRIVRPEPGSPGNLLERLVSRSGETVIRAAMYAAMRIMGHQFVMGRTIGEALTRCRNAENKAYRHSYDMLGEAARSTADAERYFDAYSNAIRDIAAAQGSGGSIFERIGVSVKLSALHPRLEQGQRDRVLKELVPRLMALVEQARDGDVALTVDAEEADRLELTLDVVEAVYSDRALGDWEGFGLALQSYQKRAPQAVEWLAELVRTHGRAMPLRLVKGAYWDAEIKRAQQLGLRGYPVFTQKANTDVAFLACARAIAGAGDLFYPQFATHNAHTLAALMELMGDRRHFEFQRLHGMGEALYDDLVEAGEVACRIYAPVGSHKDLLPYLVRRLLENGSNTSFINRIVDAEVAPEVLAADPATVVRGLAQIPHPAIPLPVDLYGKERRNSTGIEFGDPDALQALQSAMTAAVQDPRTPTPLVCGEAVADGERRAVFDPADNRREVGAVISAGRDTALRALAAAAAAAVRWDKTPAEERASCLERAADLYETNHAELMALCAREGGKTLHDGIAEVREAADFLRYYAARAREHFAAPKELPGPTGEANSLRLHGRGVFLCISPWNFPLAIFTGQVGAALAAGNAVIAKPAHQTNLIGHRAAQLLHEAGIPGDVLHFLPLSGRHVGEWLLPDRRVAGVAFTGSTDTARRIHRQLADRDGPIVPLIAETGGQNAMIVDSSALPEQVVVDVLESAFASAGQRCSALRAMYVQEDVAERMLEVLRGAMGELSLGDPMALSTDVGPVIDAEAKAELEAHIERMKREARLIYQVALPDGTAHGTFVPPTALEIDGIERLEREVFGPILHVVRYKAQELDRVIDAINGTGYGLTLGVHSRIEGTARHVRERARVGNLYVNRNMVGAVVGVQPFGGEGLSGTGPKAGGPHYLFRFATERTYTVNTAAVGGNAALLSLEPTASTAAGQR